MDNSGLIDREELCGFLADSDHACTAALLPASTTKAARCCCSMSLSTWFFLWEFDEQKYQLVGGNALLADEWRPHRVSCRRGRWMPTNAAALHAPSCSVLPATGIESR